MLETQRFVDCSDCGVNYNATTYDASTRERTHVCQEINLKRRIRALRSKLADSEEDRWGLREQLVQLKRGRSTPLTHAGEQFADDWVTAGWGREPNTGQWLEHGASKSVTPCPLTPEIGIHDVARELNTRDAQIKQLIEQNAELLGDVVQLAEKILNLRALLHDVAFELQGEALPKEDLRALVLRIGHALYPGVAKKTEKPMNFPSGVLTDIIENTSRKTDVLDLWKDALLQIASGCADPVAVARGALDSAVSRRSGDCILSRDLGAGK